MFRKVEFICDGNDLRHRYSFFSCIDRATG